LQRIGTFYFALTLVTIYPFCRKDGLLDRGPCYAYDNGKVIAAEEVTEEVRK
jgi:hypothetical protein